MERVGSVKRGDTRVYSKGERPCMSMEACGPGMRKTMSMNMAVQHDPEVIRLNSDCMSCILKKELEHFPEDLPEQQRLLYKQRVLLLVGSAKPTMSPSEITRNIYEIQRKMFGRQIDYPQIKSFFNRKMMQYAEKTEKWIREADDPLLRAISCVSA